jgi:DNA-binding CsgD family transcriptional regulator
VSSASSEPDPSAPRATHVADSADSGVVLINAALQPVAVDAGAARILARDHGTGNGQAGPKVLPDEILLAIRNWRLNGAPLSVVPVHIGERSYRCRLYGIISGQGACHPAVVAVLMENGCHQVDPIRRLVLEHHLTEREEQALHGIALGLSTKELAGRMAISPNTVKSFVRLIMIKLGVTSRAAIMVRLLESAPGGSG